MKYAIFFFCLFTSTRTLALEKQHQAVVRDAKFKAQIAQVELKDLLDDQAFEGKYFKIVAGKNNHPIRFKDSSDLTLKAATVYYHLSRARDFFVHELHSDYVAQLPQLTIRLDLTNVFNEIGHFAHDNLDPQFNNALSIPAGVGSPSRRIEPWGLEIWFRPSKKIHIDELGGSSVSLKMALKSFRNQTHMNNLDLFLKNFFQMSRYGTINANNLVRLAGSSVLLELLYQSSDFTGQFFDQKIYFLESALVPEIIYHEYSHIALSDSLKLTHSSPVNEGMADYFAGQIAKSSKLATHIKDYNLFSGKKVRLKQQYRLEFESNEMANTDFVFGLMWQMGKTLGPELEGLFIYQMREHLESSSTIKDDLINATMTTCKSHCKEPINDRLKLYRLFNSKNL